jgi:peroxiredoxin
MRSLLCLAVLGLVVGLVRAEDKPAEQPKVAPKVVLKSPDGKQAVDLEKLTSQGPVLVRLTCACTGCDAELPFFKKLQEAYNTKGLQTVAVFREAPEKASDYAVKKDVKFTWLSDPKGELWKVFDSTAMPTNILIEKGGKVIKIIPGCKTNGANAQAISAEVAKLLGVEEVKVMAEPAPKK